MRWARERQPGPPHCFYYYVTSTYLGATLDAD